MKKVNLFTASGEYVVTLDHMPPFQSMPEVICWGVRIFVWHNVEQQYREAFAYAYVGTFNTDGQ